MIKIGILGAGYIAKTHIEASQQVEGCSIVGLWTRKNSKNAIQINKEFGIKIYSSIEKLIKDSDIVDICLPTFLHHKYAILVANMGKDIMLEKPMSMNLKEADEIIVAVKKNKVKLMVAHCIRFWPEYVFLKEIIDNKILGQLLYLNCFRYSTVPLWSSNSWLLNEKKSCGPIIDFHIHDSDFVLFACGEPKGVTSVGFKCSNKEWIRTEYDFGKEVFVTTEGGWISEGDYEFLMGWRAIFQKGVIEYNSRNSPTIYISTDKNVKLKYYDNGKENTNGYIEEIKYFVKKVIEDNEIEIATGEDGKKALKIVLTELESLKKGNYMKVRF